MSLQSGTATAGADFQALPLGILLFEAGVTTRTVTVTLFPDQTTEPVETLRAVLLPVGSGVIGIGPVGTTTISIVDQPGETYASWSALKFSAAQLANPAVSGKSADPDGDGVVNVLEYALDGHPLAAASAPRPQSAFEDVPGEDIQRHSLTFARRRQALDLTYIVQRSIDGVTWQEGATLSPTGITSTPDIIQLVSASGFPVESRVVRDGAPVVAGQQFWLRLKVVCP